MRFVKPALAHGKTIMANEQINPFDDTEVLSDSLSIQPPTKDKPDYMFLRIPICSIQKPRKPFELKLAGTDSSGKPVYRVPSTVCTMYESADHQPFKFTVRVDRKASDKAKQALYNQGISEGKQVIAIKGDDQTYEIVLRPEKGGKEAKVKIHGVLESPRAILRKQSAPAEELPLAIDDD